jgi:two-component system nitrogen regulation response regulator GlnG
MLNASGNLIRPEFLPAQFQALPASCHGQPAAAGTDAETGGQLTVSALVESLLPRAGGRLYEEVVAAVERILLPRVLRETHGHLGQASELLGLNRSTLRHRLRTLGLKPDRALGEANAKDEAEDG